MSVSKDDIAAHPVSNLYTAEHGGIGISNHGIQHGRDGEREDFVLQLPGEAGRDVGRLSKLVHAGKSSATRQQWVGKLVGNSLTQA